MNFEALKVGELARRTGLTVRTLHHYDEIGLLRPSLHTDSGHRLYTGRDVARLQQVLSLRQLGFSLEEARQCLDRPGFSPLEVIGCRLRAPARSRSRQTRLCERLEADRRSPACGGRSFRRRFSSDDRGDDHDRELLHAEQREQLRLRGEQVGEERIQQVQQEWPALIAQVRAEMEKRTDPTSPHVLDPAGAGPA